jgi:ankyrin repeat protein
MLALEKKKKKMENVNFVLKCLKKMGMKDDELFEPGDLSEKKNMMKVFKCISTFANTVSGTGKGVAKWKARTDANFSMAEIDQWKKDYGGIEMEFKLDVGQGDGDDGEVELGPAKPDPVVKADPADFIVSETVTTKMLGVTLDELLKAVDKVDQFEKHDTKQKTADSCSDASIKAAQYAAQLKAAAAQATDDAQRKRLLKAYDDVDRANEALVTAHNNYQDDPDSEVTKKKLHDACEELRRAAKQALVVASRRPAQCADEADYRSSRAVTVADVDVGLSELVKAVRTAKDRKDKPPMQTTEETEAASKKAAKFAAQLRNLGAQRGAQGDAAGKEFDKRMQARADEINAANRKMVEANNAYILNPTDAAAQKRHDEACDDLIRIAEGAAADARKEPPPPVKRGTYSDFTIGGAVTAGDLDASLNDVLKSVKKVEGYKETTAQKTAGNAETATKRVAYLDAQLRAVAADCDDKETKKRITAAYTDLESANQALADATDVYVADEDDAARQKGLTEACENVKKRAITAVDVAKQALDAKAAAAAKKAADEAAKKAAEKEASTKAQNIGNAEIDAESTPLHFATLKGDMSAVRDLINKGMKVDATNAQGWTPLYTAAWVGNLDLIRFFVKQGADVNVKNQEGWTPIFAAVAQGHKHIVKALAEEYSAKINVQSNQGTTPLYHACEGGRYTITKLLLDAGADVELGKKDSWKPIHGAVYNYHAKVTALLIAKGANLNTPNKELKDYTPLHIAISTKHPNLEIVEMLAAKADINCRNTNGATPLHLAVMWGHQDVTELLIKYGADLSAKNGKGRTALDVAVRNDHEGLAEVLSKKMGVAIPKLKKKITQIGSIAAPEAPPPPPDEKK